jgi:hypothetical protein
MNANMDIVPLWAAFFVTLASMMLFTELGFQLGGWRGKGGKQETESPVGSIVGAQLGLLAFLLAITFSLAITRFEERRQVLLNESNAIGTAYLRADMLPEPDRADVRRLLTEYVDVRISAVVTGEIAPAIKRSEQIHAELWPRAAAAAKADPRSVPTGLFIEALNAVIDQHATRLQAGVQNRIPGTVWFVLLSVAAMSFLIIGYHGGLAASARSPAVTVVAIAFASVFWLVLNLERPHEGALRLSQQSLLDLRSSMK